MIALQLNRLDLEYNKYYGFFLSVIFHIVFFLFIILVSTSVLFGSYRDTNHEILQDVVAIEILPEFLATKKLHQISMSPSTDSASISTNPDDDGSYEKIRKLNQNANQQDSDIKSPQPTRYSQIIAHHIKNSFHSTPSSLRKLKSIKVWVKIDKGGNILGYGPLTLLNEPSQIKSLDDAIKLANPVPPPPIDESPKDILIYKIPIYFNY